MDSQQSLVGEMIEIPSWQTFGMVIGQVDPGIGEEGTVKVLLQEHPEDPPRLWKYYTLAPGEFEVI